MAGITALPHRIIRLDQLAKQAASVAEVLEAANQTDTSPSRAQQEAGNYRKGKVTLHGLEVAIENPKGSVRSGIDSNGKTWQTVMKAHYGCFLGTKGADKDHIDVFIGPDPECELIHVVNQVKPDGRYDECKVMCGYHNQEAARKGYLANYQQGWTGLGSLVQMTIGQFKKWILSPKSSGSVKVAEDAVSVAGGPGI